MFLSKCSYAKDQHQVTVTGMVMNKTTKIRSKLSTTCNGAFEVSIFKTKSLESLYFYLSNLNITEDKMKKNK